MTGGIGPGVPYSPAVALAALTATLVTLILAFNTWWNSEGNGNPENKEVESPSHTESNESMQETPSLSIEEETTATSYLTSTPLTESDRPYNDYELDSVEDFVEGEFINLKVEAEVRLRHDDVDILEFSKLPEDDTVTQHSSNIESSKGTPETRVSVHNSQLQKSKDFGRPDGGLVDDKCVENHSSRSGVSGEISTSHEYKWIERKKGHAPLDDKYSDVVGSGESDVVQQGGTKFKDLGQTAPQFVQYESELSMNCGKENFQSKYEVSSTQTLETTETASVSLDTDNFSCRWHVIEGNSRESFNMKVADFEELDEVCDNNNIFQQMDNEYSLGLHIINNAIPSSILINKLIASDSNDKLPITESSTENNNEDLHSFISNDIHRISSSSESITQNMNSKVYLNIHEENYNNKVSEQDERNTTSKDNENIPDYQDSNEDCTCPVKSESLISSEESKNNIHESVINNISSNNNRISNEQADPDILQHSSSQQGKSIPDIVQSSPYQCETMSTSDTIFFLYDGTVESSKRIALEINSNLLPNNPIIALTEKLSLAEKILSKCTIKTKAEKIYQIENDVSGNSFTNKFDAPEKNDLPIKSCQLTEEDETAVTLSYKPSTLSQKESGEDTAEKILGVVREPGSSIVEERGKGGDKVAREEKEEEREDEREIKRGYMNSAGAKTNNASVHSCLPSPSDVTSGAMHHGPLLREVQGSGREKLIGKACASQNYHNSIAASPAEGEKKNGFPPQMAAAKDLEIEMDARSCERHDPGSNPVLLSSGRQPDKFSCLDALVDHLRELAGDSSLTEDESLGATTDHEADVSDNVTSTTENSSYVSAASEFIFSSSDKRIDILNDCHHDDPTLSAEPSISYENNAANLEYSQQSFGLLSEYYTDVSTPESSVSDINIYNIIAPYLTDADTSISSDDFSISELSKNINKNEESLENYKKDTNEKENSLSKSDSVTLALTSVLNPLRSKTSQSSVEKLSPVVIPARNLASKLISKETINSEIMADSLNRDRLLKLLERNKKRQERLQHLSKLTNEPGGDNEHSQEQKNDAKHTLEALESAIGHIQQLINNDPVGNFRKKELDLVHRTIAIPRSTEADTDISILGKDHENMYAHHAQMKIPSRSTVDRTQVHRVYPFEMNRANKTETARPWVQSRNAMIDEKQNYPINCANMQNISEHTPIIKEWEVHSGNENSSICKIGEKQLLVVSEGDRWRYNETKEADKCVKISPYISPEKHAAKRNYEPISQFSDNFGIQNENLKTTKLPYKKSGGYEMSFNVEWEPNSKMKSMSIETERGRCESYDVAVSQPLRLRATERTAVAEGQSFRDDIARKQFLRPLVMQEEQQNGEGSDGTVKNDSPSKQNAATNTTTTTPTKIKNLRFKLDPDIYDLPSENGYEEDETDYRYRRGWKRQPKYQTFSSLELGRRNGNNREPIKVVSVRTSVVPGSQKIQKMVVKPVCVSEGQRSNPKPEDNTLTVKHLDIDLHIRLETSENGEKVSEPTNDVVRGDWRASPEKHLSKRQYANTSPSGQHIKKRSPIPEFSGWNQSLSPVTENCDWTPGANESAEDIALLSTSSDPGQCHRWTPDSGHQSPASWDVEDASFRFKNDFHKSETLDSFLAMDSGECNAQRTDESRYVTLSRSSDNFFLDNECPTSDSAATISSSNSTPSRPSSLSLSHFRKHLNLPKKRFVPDPEAIERITGYKAAEQTSASRPPLPPGLIRPLPSYRLGSGAKYRIDQLRKRYLDSAKSQMMAAQKIDGTAKFEQFLSQAQRDRANLVTSTPDLAAFEAAVRRQWSKTTMENKRKALTENNGNSSKENTPPPLPNEEDIQYRSRSNTPDHVWMSYVQLLRRQLNRRSQSLSYLETDVDAIFGMEDISQSMTTLERSPSPESTKSVVSMPICTNTKPNRISISLEESGRTKSEHELRIEKSLQTLTLPDWYKHSSRPKTGFLLDKKPKEKRGWAAAKSLASSTSSLASSDPRNKRPARSLRASRENLPWSRGSASPASADNSFKGWSRSNSGPVLSLALAKAFREPYIGWRARTPSSCASSSPQVDLSPPSWVVMGDNTNTDRSETPLTSDFQGMEEEGDTGISFDGEDILEEDSTSDQIKEFVKHRDSLLMEIPSADDTCDDVINISMDTCDDQRAPHLTNGHGNEVNNSHNAASEDTCEDIKNITLDTFEDQICEKVISPQTGDDTCDDVLNISTDTTSSRAIIPHLNGDADRNVSHHHDNRESTEKNPPEVNIILPSSKPLTNGSTHHSGSESPVVPKTRDKDLITRSKFDPKRKRYSYNRSIYQSELDGLRRDNDQRTSVDIRCSTRSLPGKNQGDYDEDEKDLNKVIWIESSFVGSRTTTSIVVLPTNANGEKDRHKGESTGSNSSVGRPASR